MGKRESERARVLTEANGLVHGERNAHYGSPTENFTRIATMWNVLLERKLGPGQKIEPADVAALMVATKLARNVAAPKRDNWVDMAGYAACGWEAHQAHLETYRDGEQRVRCNYCHRAAESEGHGKGCKSPAAEADRRFRQAFRDHAEQLADAASRRKTLESRNEYLEQVVTSQRRKRGKSGPTPKS